VERRVGELLGTLRAYDAEGTDVSLTFHGGEVIFGETVLTEESMLFDQLARELTSLGADSIVFRPGVTADELTRLVGLIASGADALGDQGGLAAAVDRIGTPHIDIAAVTPWTPGAAWLDDSDTKGISPQGAYDAALEAMRGIQAALAEGSSLDATAVRSAVFSLLDNVIRNRQAMVGLAGMMHADEREFDHAVNVAVLSLAVGSEISDDPRFLDGLGVGGLLHDVGKFSAPSDSRGDSSSERDDAFEHPILGAERVARMPGLDRAAVVIIYEHHQGADSLGYPVPAPGHRQALASRIVAVADAYDRMTASPEDSPSLSPGEAMDALVARAGADLDEDVVSLFVEEMRASAAEARRVVPVAEAGDEPSDAVSGDVPDAGIDTEENL
ncbi:MAG: HD domain-containing phosphohydrolase, partial [Actinomycetes bacterium]